MSQPIAVRGAPSDYPRNTNLTAYLFSSAHQHTAAPAGAPDHTFDGQPVPEDRPCLVDAASGKQLSWGEVRDRVWAAAAGLRDRVTPLSGDHAGVIHSPSTTLLLHLPNTLAFPMLLLGAIANGLTVSPISPLLTSKELSVLLAKARPALLCTTLGAGESVIRAAVQELAERPLDVGPGGRAVKRWADDLLANWGAKVFTVDTAADYFDAPQTSQRAGSDWTKLLRPTAKPFVCEEMHGDEQRRRAALLLWSSGTTGASKGVLLSHRNFVANTHCFWTSCPVLDGPRRGAFGGGERWVALAPWCHVYGLGTLLLPTFAFGVTLVIPPPGRFDLLNYLRLLTQYRATYAHIAPPIAVLLRHTPLLSAAEMQRHALDLSTVKGMMSGGAPVPPEVIAGVYERSGVLIQMSMGTTETISTSGVRSTTLEHSLSEGNLGSSGLVFDGGHIRIAGGASKETVDRWQQECAAKHAAGERVPLGPGAPGEILIGGDNVMLGYFSGKGCEEGDALDVETTRAAFTSDGLYRTGDEGVLDAKGNLWITGRIKELIKVKGFQVAPVELDSLFAKHPALLDAAATGLVQEGQERVVIFVSPADSAVLQDERKQASLVEELAQWAAPQIAYYKQPSLYVFCAAIPKSPTGKILRKDLKNIAGTRHVAPRVSRSARL